MDVPLVFSNDQLVVLDKPAFCLSVLDRVGSGRELGRKTIFDLTGVKPGEWLSVHRLDYEVSGLLVLAKNRESHKLLSVAFETRSVVKTYHALTEGSVPEIDTFEWESKLVRGKKRTFEAPHGKVATTRARFNGKDPKGSLQWEIEPLTGRSHQIRFHLAKAGYPILGDKKYASKLSYEFEGIALRAVKLGFNDAKLLDALSLPANGIKVQGLF